MVYYISQDIHVWIIVSREYKHIPLNVDKCYAH